MTSHNGPGDGLEKPPAAVPLQKLKERGDIMFSGATGAAVGSGRGQVTTAPSYGLAKAVSELMEKLPPELFDRWAAHRPCGLLCKLSAAGMLVCDVLGLPLPPFELAEPIGKATSKVKEKIAGEQAKAKKAAARKGQDQGEAAASVLRRAVRLPIPSAADIARAWRELAKATATPPAGDQPAAEAPAPAPESREPALEPAPVLVSGAAGHTEYKHPSATYVNGKLVYGDDAPPGYRGICVDECRYWNPHAPPCVPSDLRPMQVFGMFAAAKAAAKAVRVEQFMQPADYDPECDHYDQERDEVARLEYQWAMSQLQDQELCPDPCPMFAHASQQHTRPCPCGLGVLAKWPWVIHSAELGFCTCEMAEWELICWRD